ncbi:class I SAM-dependent methyltransferase [Archangium violaceum]|uniref:class I SAM-dependent methyltransferase n=1 Tax=Archangium violaceum TaxID=83451 RepID=UPI0036D9A86D
MDDARNPQAEQMADESMARTLAHQAEAIWPQEQHLFERYGLSGPLNILDLGCGTGQITRRLASRYPQAQVLGIDILESNLAIARQGDVFGGRIRYARGDAFALEQGDANFELVVCRHMSQAVPDFPQVLAEITRVLKPGGWLHLLSEDYGMLHMPVPPDGSFDPDRFWNEIMGAFERKTACDVRIGRHSPPLLERFGYRDIAMNYITVDTLRVPRATFAGIIKAWRDGYVKPLAEASGRSIAEVTTDFNILISALETPPQYAVWHVPIVSGRKPE